MIKIKNNYDNEFMTESINLLNIIDCNFDTDNNLSIQNDFLKAQLKTLEENYNNYDYDDYLIKKGLLSKIIKYLEDILYQVMSAKDRKFIKYVQELLDKEDLEKSNTTKNTKSPSSKLRHSDEMVSEHLKKVEKDNDY